MSDAAPDQEPMLFVCSHGPDDPERATVPYILASVAATAGQRSVVVCTVEGVRTGTTGVADQVHSEGLTPLAELVDSLVDAGGEIWLCSACANKRGITEDDCIEGASIVGAAQIVEALAAGRAITPA